MKSIYRTVNKIRVPKKDSKPIEVKEFPADHRFIGTEGTFGLMPYALEIYLVDNKNVTIKGFWPISDVLPKELKDASKQMPTYVLFYQSEEAPISWPRTLIYRYEKENPKRPLTLYKINP